MILMTKVDKPANDGKLAGLEAVIQQEMNNLSADRVAAICLTRNGRIVRCWCVPYNANGDVVADWNVRINLALTHARWMSRKMT